MNNHFPQYTTDYISGVMSLRKPQKESLIRLEKIPCAPLPWFPFFNFPVGRGECSDFCLIRGTAHFPSGAVRQR